MGKTRHMAAITPASNSAKPLSRIWELQIHKHKPLRLMAVDEKESDPESLVHFSPEVPTTKNKLQKHHRVFCQAKHDFLISVCLDAL